MKVVRLVLIMVVVLSAVMSVNAQKKNEKTVIFNANLHCESCKAKVEKNIPYEKGVKDLKKQTIRNLSLFPQQSVDVYHAGGSHVIMLLLHDSDFLTANQYFLFIV